MSHGRICLGVALLCAAAVASACSSRSDHPGGKETSKETGHVIRNAAAGVWELDREKLPSATSTEFVALVSRLGCNNGVTGKAVKPVVKMSKSQSIVTFQVTPGEPKAADCPGNNLVPYEVKLSEPIAGRQLIDGRCLPGGEAETTSLCESSRWKLSS